MDEQKEIKKAVGRYLEKVAAELGDVRADEKDTILQEIESHVYDTLAARAKGTPTVADLELVLAEMAPPASYREAYATKPPEERTPRKFCKYPLIGAAFAPFGVMLGAMYVGNIDAPDVERFVLPILILGLISPVATLVFGLMGISAIRTSRGRLTGMPLSVALTLLYPLVVLDYTMFTVAYAAAFNLGMASVRNDHDWALGIAYLASGMAVLLALVIDVILIRLLWRWASRPVAAGEFT